jgi:probable rRNA maturation factor
MFSITNLTKKQIPKILWKKIKEKVLGRKYELSLVFAGNALMKKLNARYRRKDKPASALSFPLSKSEAPRLPSTKLRTSRSGQGEIFINLSQKKHSPLFLFIHGLLHLKGFKHSARMEVREQRLMKEYEKRYYHRA